MGGWVFLDFKPKKGGGGTFGKNVDLCTIPYGALFGPRGGVSSDPPDPRPGYTGL